MEPKILKSEVGKPILGRGFRVDNGISYQRLQLREMAKKYFFIDFKLAEKDKWQGVSINITVDGTDKAVTQCQYNGNTDSCYIPKNYLKENMLLFLTIQCQDDCTYNINTRWNNTEHLKPGDNYIFTFGKENSQLYHVGLEGKKFEEFRLHISQRVTQRPLDRLKIYGKYGNNSEPTPE